MCVQLHITDATTGCGLRWSLVRKKGSALRAVDRISQMCIVLSCFFCSFPHLYILISCYLLLQFPLPASGGKSSLPYAALRVKNIFPVIMVYLVGSPVGLQTLVIILSSATSSYLDTSYMQFLFPPLVVTLFSYLCKLLNFLPHSVMPPQCYKMLTYCTCSHYFSVLIFKLELIV